MRRRYTVGFLVVSILLACLSSASSAAQALAVARVATGGATSPGPLVRLYDGTETLPDGSEIAGVLQRSVGLSVDVELVPANPAALEDFVSRVSDPSSPEYRHYLAPGQFGQRFGAAPATVRAVSAWLTSRGFTDLVTDPDELSIAFRAPASRIESGFGVTLDRYSVAGTTRFAPDAAPLVPLNLAPRIEAVLGLSDLGTPRPLAIDATRSAGSAAGVVGTRSLTGAAGSPTACASASEQATLSNSYTAQQLATAYSMTGVYSQDRFGAGISVALFELEPFAGSDIAAFQSCFGTHADVNLTDVDGGPGSGTGGGEAALDIEQVIGLAPGATVHVYEGVNFRTATATDVLDVYKRIADDDSSAVVSTSWGACESELTPGFAGAERTVFEQLASQGESVYAASGDAGSEDCFVAGASEDTALQVDDPGSQPNVTSVGGTSLTSVGPAPTETTWNGCEGQTEQSCAVLGAPFGAGGGGISSSWTMQPWESGPGVQSSFSSGVPCGSITADCREVPDVSSSADPEHGDVIYFDGFWQTVGGTSGSAPLWAAITAVADQGCIDPGRSLAESHVVGFADPELYVLGSATNPPYNDVTTGDNDFTDTNAGRFPASGHYDMATGWGTPIGSTLVPDLQPAGGCPSVTRVSPSAGVTAGGTVVSISGSDLAGVTSVHFGSAPATAVSYDPGLGVVLATSPASPVRGVAQVTVTTSNGTSAAEAPSEFTYFGPSVSRLVPAGGPPGGGTEVEISGGGFAAATAVHFGTLEARRFSVVSDGLVTAVSPAGTNGSTVNVTVTTSSGTSPDFSPDRFLYTLRPVVGAVTPGSGTVRGGTRVVISGASLESATAVDFGGVAIPFSASGIGTIVVETPPSVSGASVVGVVVVNRFGPSAPADFRYFLPMPGYWLVGSDGGVFSFGAAHFAGSMGGTHLAAPVVGIASTADDGGYWLAASDGGVFSFGDAHFAGSMGGRHLDAPVVGIASTADGGGYWLVSSDGGVFSFGDAHFAGSMGGTHLNAPVVGIAGAADRGGYWLIASDGGVFSFGNAHFSGSMGGRRLDAPVVGIAAPASGRGYWLVASDGGVFSFDAGFYGSAADLRLVDRVVGAAST